MKKLLIICALFFAIGCSKNPVSSIPVASIVQSKVYIQDTLVADIMTNKTIKNYSLDTNVSIALNILVFHQEKLFPEFIPYDNEVVRQDFEIIKDGVCYKWMFNIGLPVIIGARLSTVTNRITAPTDTFAICNIYAWVYNGKDTIRVLQEHQRQRFNVDGVNLNIQSIDYVTFKYDSTGYQMTECTWKKFGKWDYDFIITTTKDSI